MDPDLPDPPTVFAGKLDGEHTWPFSFNLPRGICVMLSDNVKHNFRLPATLMNDASKTQIRYKIVARVKKGLLTADNRRVHSGGPHLR